MFAIVDIETTGGHASANGITEIAIILHDGVRPVKTFHSLVNPGMPIPPYVSALTGIDDAMVAEAPSFGELAPHVALRLQGCVFVAHNVNFDYSFIRHHLLLAGIDFNARKLCTVRLSRKIMKGLPSYSLGNLCRSLDIAIKDRHRAMGDAEATMRLFERILKEDTEGVIGGMLKAGSRDRYLPLHLPSEQVESLPQSPGVYYFHDARDRVVYVGKAVNIRQRVVSHFSNNNPSRRKQELMRTVHRISHEACPSELIATLRESLEIHRLWPRFNHSQKRWEYRYAIQVYEDRRGVIRFMLDVRRRNSSPLVTVSTLTEGHSMLRRLVHEFTLCPIFCSLEKTADSSCSAVFEGHCNGACCGKESIDVYNERVLDAIHSLKTFLPSFALFEDGFEENEQTAILVENGEFVGMGPVPRDKVLADRKALREILTPYPDHARIRSLLMLEAERNPHKVRFRD
jgi:DNA polymerase-3 subunit epsilon